MNGRVRSLLGVVLLAALADGLRLVDGTELKGWLRLAPETASPKASKPPASSPDCGTAPDFEPCVGLEEANSLFASCCSDELLPSACVALCRYDVDFPTFMAETRSQKCPQSNFKDILACASQGNDNRPCCRAKSVFETSAALCLPFCATGEEASLGPEEIVCAARVADVLACHRAGLPRPADSPPPTDPAPIRPPAPPPATVNRPRRPSIGPFIRGGNVGPKIPSSSVPKAPSARPVSRRGDGVKSPEIRTVLPRKGLSSFAGRRQGLSTSVRAFGKAKERLDPRLFALRKRRRLFLQLRKRNKLGQRLRNRSNISPIIPIVFLPKE